jgi:predicted phosphodiesterase
MRLVCIADTHLFHDDLQLPAGDVLIHAGDLLRGGDLEELEQGLVLFSRAPHKTKIFVAGNHDQCFEEHQQRAVALLGPDITYLQDSGVTVDGLQFWGSPWQPAFNDWAFNLRTPAELANKWALIPEFGVDVLITHGPPRGLGDGSAVARPLGCLQLRARVAVVQPKLHVFGHIHQAGGAWHEDGTLFVNCTTWECERPASVVDLERGPDGWRVTRQDIPPRETAR